jgi:pimeloyl-ACP methyl ester carboxylesterase
MVMWFVRGRATRAAGGAACAVRLEVEGRRIAFRRMGEGPPLVLVHGGLGDSRDWRRQLNELSNEFTVVAWDPPGSGSSSDPPETFGMPDYADCLAAFIGALGLQRPHVLGLSFGGRLVLELTAGIPGSPRSDLCSTLVVCRGSATLATSRPQTGSTPRSGLPPRPAKLSRPGSHSTQLQHSRMLHAQVPLYMVTSRCLGPKQRSGHASHQRRYRGPVTGPRPRPHRPSTARWCR